MFFALVIIPFFTEAQNRNVNPLETKTDKYSSDTSKINILFRKAELYAFKLNEIRKAKLFTDSAYNYSVSVKYTSGIAKHWNLYGEYSERAARYSESLKYQNIALSFCKLNNDLNLEARVLNDMGTVFRRTDNFTSALKYLQESFNMATTANNELYKMYALNGIGNCNVSLRNYETAFNDYIKALEIAQNLNNKTSIAINYNNLGEIYELQNDAVNAFEYYDRALKIDMEIGNNKGVSLTNSCIGNLLFSKGDYLKALGYYSRALDSEIEMFEKLSAARDNINVGRCYLKLGKYQKAEEYIQNGLETAQDIDSKSAVRDAFIALSELCAQEKNFEQAYNYMQKYSVVKDSVINEKIVGNYAKLQVQYELEQNKAHMLIMEQDRQKQQIILTKNRILIISGALLIIFIIILIFGYIQNRLRSKLNKELSEKNAQILNANEQLTAEVGYRDETENILRTLLHEKEILISEVHHRVKNNLALITGLMYLQAQKVVDLQSKGILNETISRIHSIALIHENIYLSEKNSMVNFGIYLTKQVDDIKKVFNNPNVELEINIPEFSLELHQAVPLGLIANELISNAFRHAFVGRENGKITINFTGNPLLCRLEIRDNGIGLPENFVYEKVEAPGFIIISIFVKQLSGFLRTINSDGAVFILEFAPTLMKVWK